MEIFIMKKLIFLLVFSIPLVSFSADDLTTSYTSGPTKLQWSDWMLDGVIADHKAGWKLWGLRYICLYKSKGIPQNVTGPLISSQYQTKTVKIWKGQECEPIIPR